MGRVLVIDDDAMICEMLAEFSRDLGHECLSERSLVRGRDLAAREAVDVVFLDVFLPDGRGMDHLAEIKEGPGNPEVIVITGYGDAEIAEEALRSGAWNYVQKPLTWSGVTEPLKRALTYRSEQSEPGRAASVRREGIAGSGPEISAVLDTVAVAARSESGVLIYGETGTGKELIARAIHSNSARSGGPFVVVDCASLPGNLVESILFGHVKGAFTGADANREGLVKQAHGGTLFLDEVGELPYAMQRKFLRVLEQHSFRPVGAKYEETSDFRVVAATNRDLDQLVEAKRFRQDLLFRIRSFNIELPPLRVRVSDIAEIVRMHMDRMGQRLGLPEQNFSPEFMDALRAYPWPGNVRELVNCLERSMAASRNAPTLYLMHLPENVRAHYARTLVKDDGNGDGSPGVNKARDGERPSQTWGDFREQAMAEAEKKYFRQVLALTSGDVKETCRIAGVSRARLYQILQKTGLSRTG